MHGVKSTADNQEACVASPCLTHTYIDHSPKAGSGVTTLIPPYQMY